jgi:cyclic pyranopterin phosphate synthase
MPTQGIQLLSHRDILTYEEIATIARTAAELGITKVRLTGGEPLVRARLTELIAMIASIATIDDISLTTNGVLLKKYAYDLKKAGLKRVNICLDTLNPQKFLHITRYHKLDDVLQGIKTARECGLEPVKINMVVMRGINDDEILDFAKLTMTDGWHVRFIELMPFATENPHEIHATRSRAELHPQYMAANEIMERLSTLDKLQPSDTVKGNGPARYYFFPNTSGTVGFITPVSEHFCFQCNRLRLTAEGKLRPCLLSDEEIDLRPTLRQGALPEQLKRLIRKAIQDKPRHHQLAGEPLVIKRRMSQVGG